MAHFCPESAVPRLAAAVSALSALVEQPAVSPLVGQPATLDLRRLFLEVARVLEVHALMKQMPIQISRQSCGLRRQSRLRDPRGGAAHDIQLHGAEHDA